MYNQAVRTVTQFRTQNKKESEMKFFKRLKKYAAKIMRLKIEYGGSLEKDYWSEREYEQRQVLYSSLLKQTTY